AAQACLLVLELGDDDHDPLDFYGAVSTVIVHPKPVVLQGQRSTATSGVMTDAPTRIDGQAHYEGPVIVAWNAVTTDARHPRRGLNVVYHEFAHKLDMLDGTVDGTPPPPLLGLADRPRWIEVCTREFRSIRAGTDDGFLREYGGTDPGEFFAVAVEMFFSRPVEMRDHRSELYELLTGVFRQDPARRYPEPASAPGA
ncbi:MAG TPA: M90 family metallopeptidase, partial [Ilumatobacteraceae bacterium]|nr:M90 family metallopeptidase [Ilumatobacteraceae bacterium]